VSKKYIIVKDGAVKLSSIVNDGCLDICVPTYDGEPLSSVLRKICRQATSSTQASLASESDPIFTSSAAYNITSNDIVEWNLAFDNMVTAIGFSGGSTKTLTLSKEDGSILTADFTVVTTDELLKISANDTTAGYAIDKITAGQGVIINELNDGGDEDLEVTLDLDATTLVSPVITVDWDVYQDDGTTLITSSASSNITVETGSKVSIDSTYLYPVPGVGEAAPTSVSGSYGATLFPPATPSAPPFTNGGVQITANTTFTQTLSKPKSGLIVVGSQVQFASGNDTTSASVSVAFLYASYFGYSTNTSLTGPQIKALGNKNLQSSRTRTLTGVSAAPGEYTYYCYPASYGALVNVIQDNSLPILGAFTRLADVNITNDAGVVVLMAVYKSNADNAFTNVELDFE
jgi:plastocyanin